MLVTAGIDGIVGVLYDACGIYVVIRVVGVILYE